MDKRVPAFFSTGYPSTSKPWIDHLVHSSTIVDHEEGKIGQVHDAMVASHNMHTHFRNREFKRDMHFFSPECRGVKPLRSDYIGDVISGGAFRSTEATSFFSKVTPPQPMENAD